MDGIIDIGTIEATRSQRDLWRAGHLMPEWKQRFPELFDEHDVAIAETQRYAHFWEWLAAIVLYHTTGYRAPIEKYAYPKHTGKRQIVARLLTEDVRRVLLDPSEHGLTQGPDLLMYAPYLSDWFFCEVKGPGDRLRPVQVSKFEALARASGRPVRLLHLRWAGDPDRVIDGPTVSP